MVSVEVTFCAAGVFGCILLTNIVYANRINRISKAYNQTFISLSTYVTLLTQNRKFFKATKSRGVFTNTVLNKVKEVNSKSWDLNLVDGILRTFTIMAGMAFVIMVFLFHPMLDINFSELILLLLVFNRLAPQFTSLSGNYTPISERIPIHQSIKNRIIALKENLEVTGSKKFEALNPIRFEDISFAYKKNKLVLKKVNLGINPLSSIAIVGGSGAGKSTLLDLFLGLLKPTSGVVHYGDIHHEELDIETLRGKVSYVSQNTTLLDGSLLYNLTITNPGVNETEVKDVCRKAQLNDFINKLPDGLATEIGENGIKLSGGQRQRIALGRALITNPEILILDEATSQLDSETERFIQQAIKELHKKLTIIIVAHRLSTVRFADTIYVLEKGEIIEQGTYSELLEQKGKLYELDVLQHG
jgi:ABC-type multidrug transport system fused ATPase/permease subunit